MKPRPIPLLHISAAVALAFTATAHAVPYTWGGGNLGWTDTSASGWNGGPPVSGDTATINTGTVTTTANNQQNGVALTIGSSGVLNAANYMYFNTTGSLTLNSGTINVTAADGYGWRAGSLSLSVNANSGSSFINGSGLGLRLEGNTTFSGAGDLTISANLFDTYNGSSFTATSITKEGAGTLTLGGTLGGSTAVYSGGTTVNGGTLVLAGYNVIGVGAGPLIINNSGSLVTMTGNYSVNIGSLTLNGGELSSGGFFDATYGSYYLNNDVTVGAGTSTISAVKITSGGVRSFDVASGGTLNVTGNFSSLYGSFGLTKTGSGTMTLSGSNDYTGATTVSAGKLKVTGSIASSDVTVNGGILASGSTGTVGNNVTVNTGATFAAGDVATVGAASVASNLNFSSGSIFDWDLTTASNTYDTVSVAGSLNITSGAKFNVVSSTAFTDTFWDATHTWSNIFGSKTIDNFLVSNFLYSGSATAPTAEGFFTVSGTNLTWTAVPEPTSALAGLLIAAGLLRRRR
jgi:autotransporter-associated beta strand protein